MAASSLVDLVKIYATNQGTGALTLGEAVQGYRGVEALLNGATYSYSIQQDAQWEIGKATYLAVDNQLVRTPTDSSNGGGAVDFQANASVAFVALSEDILARDVLQPLYGFGPPLPGQGLIGQTYTSLTQPVTLYGPKTANGWGSGVVLQGAPGKPGTAASYETLDELKAADPEDLFYVLLDRPGGTSYTLTSGNYEGQVDDVNVVKLNDVPLATGALVRQDSGSIAFKARGPWAVTRSAQDKIRESISVMDFGATGNGTTKDTAAVQACIDYVEATGGGVVHFPLGTYRCNVIAGHRVKLRGVGRVCTTLKSAEALPVFRLPVGKSVTRIGIEDMYLEGDYAHTDADVINLQPSGQGIFADDILLRNILVQNGGRDGIYVEGVASIGPFVQRLKLDTCEVRANRGNQLRLRGTVLETEVDHCSFSRPAGTPGTSGSAIASEFNGDYPLRARFTACTIDNAALVGTPSLAFGVFLNGYGNFSFRSCNFEFCGPAIATGESPFATGLTVQDCNFGFGENVENVIHLRRSRSTSIRNCSFRVAAGHTITSVLFLDGGMSDLRQVELKDCTGQGTITNWVRDPSSFYQDIAGGTIRKWRDTIIVLGQGAAADDLDWVRSADGGDDLFAGGETVVLMPFANFENVTVKHNTGNLLLSGATDYLLNSAEKSITFCWNIQRKKWIEVSRS